MSAKVHRVELDGPELIENDDSVELRDDETDAWLESDTVVVLDDWE